MIVLHPAAYALVKARAEEDGCDLYEAWVRIGVEALREARGS